MATKKPSRPEKIEVVVTRSGEATFAIVSAMTTNISNEHTFLARLTEALTEWVRTTKEGKKAWEYSCYDFNIGDLAGLFEEVNGRFRLPLRLEKELAKRGIRNLTIVGSSYDGVSRDWSYDQVLIMPINEDEG